MCTSSMYLNNILNFINNIIAILLSCFLRLLFTCKLFAHVCHRYPSIHTEQFYSNLLDNGITIFEGYAGFYNEWVIVHLLLLNIITIKYSNLSQVYKLITYFTSKGKVNDKELSYWSSVWDLQPAGGLSVGVVFFTRRLTDTKNNMLDLDPHSITFLMD